MTEALDHYLQQRDEDYEREGETMMSRLSDDEKRVFSDQISMLKGENERLTKYIEDYEDDTRKVMEEKCASDEVHCTCVPVLRKENEVLWKYAKHKGTCPGDVYVGICTCGLNALLQDD